MPLQRSVSLRLFSLQLRIFFLSVLRLRTLLATFQACFEHAFKFVAKFLDKKVHSDIHSVLVCPGKVDPGPMTLERNLAIRVMEAVTM